MSTTGQWHLIETPNQISGMRSRLLLLTAFGLTALGFLSISNASWATAVGATKHYLLVPFFNNHWISSIYLITGASVALSEWLKLNFYLFTAVCFLLASLCVALGSMIADCVNINTVLSMDERSKEIVRSYRLLYNAVSFSVNVLVCVLCMFALGDIKHRASRYFSRLGSTTPRLLTAGIFLAFLGVSKLFCWVAELIWLHTDQREKTRFLFLNYTCDEPIWALILLMTGILVISFAITSSRILLHTSMLMCAVGYQPTIQYLWLDYRLLSQVQFADRFLQIPTLHNLLLGNITLSLLHIVGIIITLIMLVEKQSQYGSPIFIANIDADKELETGLSIFAAAFIFAGIYFLISDIINIKKETFFRLFFPTEQKLHLLLIPAGILIGCILRNYKIRYLILPAAFALIIQCLQYTIFHISAFYYLTFNSYFGHKICQLFYYAREGRCGINVEIAGSLMHFFEAFLAIGVFFVSIFVLILLGRLMGLYAARIKNTTRQRDAVQKRCTVAIFFLGAVQILLGLTTVSVIITYSQTGNEVADQHPVFVLHGTINLICYCAPFFLCGITHIVFGTKKLEIYPLRSITLLMINVLRCVDVLTSLDYRNINGSNNISSTTMFIAELVSMCIAFISITIIGLIIDFALKQLPEFDFDDNNTSKAAVDNNYAGFFRQDQKNESENLKNIKFKEMQTLNSSPVTIAEDILINDIHNENQMPSSMNQSGTKYNNNLQLRIQEQELDDPWTIK